MSPYVVVMMTASSADEAAAVGRALVDARLVACCNIVPQIRSIYRWQGKVHDEAEAMMFAKTRRDLLPDVIRTAKEAHSYDVPEIIAVPIEAGLDAYLSWIDANVGGKSGVSG